MKEVLFKFKGINEKGEKVEYDALITFEEETTAKSYVIYTDNSKDAEGNVMLYAAVYDPDDMENIEQTLEPIETEDEWQMIEEILAEVKGSLE